MRSTQNTKFRAFYFIFILLLSSQVSLSKASEETAFLSAPPAFKDEQGRNIVPIKIENYDLSLRIDIKDRKAYGIAKIDFTALETGFPFLDLVPEATQVLLDEKDLGAKGLPEVETADRATYVRVINAEIKSGETHHLEIHYTLENSDQIGFDDGGVQLGFFMNDLSGGTRGREFLEQYAPSNLEFNAFPLTLNVQLEGSTSAHQLFTNGTEQEDGNNRWKIQFPAYFTTSSFYFHLTNRNLAVKRFEYEGLEKKIPVTVYAGSNMLVDRAEEIIRKTFAELEHDYGAFAHQRFVTYITAFGGGMEHVGGAVTSLWALPHEIYHSWYARGVMPANGNAGWFDEGSASYRDQGYPRASRPPSGRPTQLSGFAAYRRDTPGNSYEDGSRLLAGLDFMFSEKGLSVKGALRELYSKRKRTPITTEEIHAFMEEYSGLPLKDIFDRYVYGKGSQKESIGEKIARHCRSLLTPKPPQPFTVQEMKTLR